MTLIPDDKSTKPSSIVVEMARAIDEATVLRKSCAQKARAAAAVVARRLREMGCSEHAIRATCRGCALLAELEGT